MADIPSYWDTNPLDDEMPVYGRTYYPPHVENPYYPPHKVELSLNDDEEEMKKAVIDAIDKGAAAIKIKGYSVNFSVTMARKNKGNEILEAEDIADIFMEKGGYYENAKAAIEQDKSKNPPEPTPQPGQGDNEGRKPQDQPKDNVLDLNDNDLLNELKVQRVFENDFRGKDTRGKDTICKTAFTFVYNGVTFELDMDEYKKANEKRRREMLEEKIKEIDEKGVKKNNNVIYMTIEDFVNMAVDYYAKYKPNSSFNTFILNDKPVNLNDYLKDDKGKDRTVPEMIDAVLADCVTIIEKTHEQQQGQGQNKDDGQETARKAKEEEEKKRKATEEKAKKEAEEKKAAEEKAKKEVQELAENAVKSYEELKDRTNKGCIRLGHGELNLVRGKLITTRAKDDGSTFQEERDMNRKDLVKLSEQLYGHLMGVTSSELGDKTSKADVLKVRDEKRKSFVKNFSDLQKMKKAMEDKDVEYLAGLGVARINELMLLDQQIIAITTIDQIVGSKEKHFELAHLKEFETYMGAKDEQRELRKKASTLRKEARQKKEMLKTLKNKKHRAEKLGMTISDYDEVYKELEEEISKKQEERIDNNKRRATLIGWARMALDELKSLFTFTDVGRGLNNYDEYKSMYQSIMDEGSEGLTDSQKIRKMVQAVNDITKSYEGVDKSVRDAYSAKLNQTRDNEESR